MTSGAVIERHMETTQWTWSVILVNSVWPDFTVRKVTILTYHPALVPQLQAVWNQNWHHLTCGPATWKSHGQVAQPATLPGLQHGCHINQQHGHHTGKLTVSTKVCNMANAQACNTATQKLYHVRVELALQKPIITHEPRMVQLPNLEDRLFYEYQ